MESVHDGLEAPVELGEGGGAAEGGPWLPAGEQGRQLGQVQVQVQVQEHLATRSRHPSGQHLPRQVTPLRQTLQWELQGQTESGYRAIARAAARASDFFFFFFSSSFFLIFF